MIELIFISVLFAAIFIAQEYRHRQDAEAWRHERSQLLQRIQAPERAVATFTSQEAPNRAVRAVGFDDDLDAAKAAEAHAGS